MLNAIRKRSGSILVKLLLGLLVLSFAAWGISDVFTGRATSDTVAHVGDAEISVREAAEEYRRELQRLRAALGGEFTPEQARQAGLAEAVVNRMIQRALIAQAAKDLGIVISDDLVRADIARSAEFQNQFGKFDDLRFQEALRNNGLSEGRFVELVRGDMMRDQLLSSIDAGALPPAIMVDALYRHHFEKRVAETALVADADMPDPATADAEALAAYHTANAKRFTAPEYRGFTAIAIDAKELAQEIAVSDDALRAAYEDRRDEFASRERRRLAQMLLPDEATAKRARGMLAEGKTFAAVAKEMAGLDEETIDLGWMTREELLPEVAEPAFAVASGETSQPIKSPLGWHLVHVVEVERASQQSFAEARDTLAKEIALEKAIDSLFAMSNQLEDALAGGATLEEAAAKLDLKAVKIDAVDATGRAPDGKAVDHPLLGPQVLDAAFSTPEGAQSPLTEKGSDSYFVLRVDRIRPPKLRPLDEVRDEVAEAWRAEQRAIAARAAAEALLKKVEAGTPLAQAAAERGIKVVTTEPITRRGEGAAEPLPPTLVAALFRGGERQAAMARAEGGHVVAQVKQVIPADPVADKATVTDLEQRLTLGFRDDVLAQYAEALRGRFAVSINRAALERIY